MPEDMSSWSLDGITAPSAGAEDTAPAPPAPAAPAGLDAQPRPPVGQDAAAQAPPAPQSQSQERTIAPVPGERSSETNDTEPPAKAEADTARPWGKDPRFQEDNEAYKAGREMQEMALKAGYPSISAYNQAAQQYQETLARDQQQQAEAQRLQVIAAELVEKRDNGEISPEMADRLYQAEINNQRAEAALAQTQQQQQSIARQIGETRFREVSQALPGFLDAVPDLAPVIRSTSDAEAVSRFTQNVQAYITQREQAAVDAYKAAQSAPAPPPALAGGGSAYQAPPPGSESKWPTFAEGIGRLMSR